MNIEAASAVAARLLSGTTPADAQRLSGGANNRVYKVQIDGAFYLLKAYFEAVGGRDRLLSDFGFCTFAWNAGVHAVPRPFAALHEQRAAIYEFVGGHRITGPELSRQIVDQAIAFFVDVNSARDATEAASLPVAAEACFSIEEHLACVERRVQRVASLDLSEPSAEAAALFARDELLPAWTSLVERISRAAATVDVQVRRVPPEARCLSPSDFGFHNALLEDSGRMRFFDFEYAGWDDPAKMICDFFCQPEVPVPMTFLDHFAADSLRDFDRADSILERAQLLLPAYQIKWCCIMLNEFLPSESARRNFSNPGSCDERRRETQLTRARELLHAQRSTLPHL